ncbi:MAG: hypothetical protein P8N94_02495 [Gammaproteobacteria bacterium]|nr:hypothetical protein [Gammaproteobacteria bacterium]
METIKTPAGKYAISDPCYLFEGDEWDDLLERHAEFACDNLFIEKQDGKEYHMAISGTAYGDGYYASDLPGSPSFAVDVGMIGAFPLELVLRSPRGRQNQQELYIHEFKSEWEFTPCDNQGVIRFGDAGAIHTGEMAQETDKGD